LTLGSDLKETANKLNEPDLWFGPVHLSNNAFNQPLLLVLFVGVLPDKHCNRTQKYQSATHCNQACKYNVI